MFKKLLLSTMLLGSFVKPIDYSWNVSVHTDNVVRGAA